MKFLIALLLLAAPAFASEERVVPEARLAQAGETVGSANAEVSQGPQSWSRASACAADLYCASGRYIGCTAQGLVTRCLRSSAWVICEAVGSGGSYSRASDSCP